MSSFNPFIVLAIQSIYSRILPINQGGAAVDYQRVVFTLFCTPQTSMRHIYPFLLKPRMADSRTLFSILEPPPGVQVDSGVLNILQVGPGSHLEALMGSARPCTTQLLPYESSAHLSNKALKLEKLELHPALESAS